jgi:hypothetical protein
MNGWIKLHRKIIDNWIWKDPVSLKIWIWCLCRANHADIDVVMKTGKGNVVVSIKRGQFLTGRKSAGVELDMAPTTFMRHLEKLKKSSNIALKPDTHWTVVTICKWEEYQDCESDNGQATRQATVQATDTDKNVKNDKEKTKIHEKKNFRGAEPDYLELLLAEFQESYKTTGQEYKIVNHGKEKKAMAKLAKIYREKYPDASTESALVGMRTYFDACVQIKDPWLKDNMSPSIIICKFNEINKILLNGKSKPINGNGASKREIVEAAAKSLGITSNKPTDPDLFG